MQNVRHFKLENVCYLPTALSQQNQSCASVVELVPVWGWCDMIVRGGWQETWLWDQLAACWGWQDQDGMGWEQAELEWCFECSKVAWITFHTKWWYWINCVSDKCNASKGKWSIASLGRVHRINDIPDSNFHVAHMGPTWVLSAPGGPHVGPTNLVIRDVLLVTLNLLASWWPHLTV